MNILSFPKSTKTKLRIADKRENLSLTYTYKRWTCVGIKPQSKKKQKTDRVRNVKFTSTLNFGNIQLGFTKRKKSTMHTKALATITTSHYDVHGADAQCRSYPWWSMSSHSQPPIVNLPWTSNLPRSLPLFLLSWLQALASSWQEALTESWQLAGPSLPRLDQDWARWP